MQLAGDHLRLLPERAAYWVERETLLVADTHWGKAATMRAAAIPIPHGTTEEDLARLSRAVERTKARRLLLLGDVLHARQGRAPLTLRKVIDWREKHPNLGIRMVRGNHDLGAGDPPEAVRLDCFDSPLVEGPFVFQHHPAPSPLGYTLAGHTHPAIRLRGSAGNRATLPCFHFTESFGVLPAFGSLTGMARSCPVPSDRVFAIADDEVLVIM